MFIYSDKVQVHKKVQYLCNERLIDLGPWALTCDRCKNEVRSGALLPNFEAGDNHSVTDQHKPGLKPFIIQIIQTVRC